MANYLGFDLGRTFRDAESIKSARVNQQINSFNLDRAKKQADASDATAAQNQAYKTKIMSGDTEALKQFAVLNPTEAAGIIENYDKLDERGKAGMKEAIEMQGQAAAVIRRSKNPEQEYLKIRAMLPPEMQEQMPEQYDPSYVELQLARAMDMDKLLEGYKVLEFGGEDLLQDNTGQVVDRTESGAERGRKVSRANALTQAETSRQNALVKADGKDGSLKSADESLMYRQAAELLGGVFDDKGNLQGLDPTIRGKVQAIATEAAKLYQKGGMSRSEAVTKAADKMGVKVPQAGVARRVFDPSTGTFK